MATHFVIKSKSSDKQAIQASKVILRILFENVT